MLNIPSYAGGTNFWGGTKEDDVSTFTVHYTFTLNPVWYSILLEVASDHKKRGVFLSEISQTRASRLHLSLPQSFSLLYCDVDYEKILVQHDTESLEVHRGEGWLEIYLCLFKA